MDHMDRTVLVPKRVPDLPEPLVDQMRRHVGQEGTVDPERTLGPRFEAPETLKGRSELHLLPAPGPCHLVTDPRRFEAISHIRAMPQAFPRVDEASLILQTKTIGKET